MMSVLWVNKIVVTLFLQLLSPALAYRLLFDLSLRQEGIRMQEKEEEIINMAWKRR